MRVVMDDGQVVYMDARWAKDLVPGETLDLVLPKRRFWQKTRRRTVRVARVGEVERESKL